MKELLQLYTDVPEWQLDEAIDFSIKKRLHDSQAKVDNTYTKKIANLTLLQLADYINKREPIVTAHGTMFKKHGEVPAPLLDVIQIFLDNRVKDKNTMFKYPKGSELYEKYNLFQQLDKIDCNGYAVAPLGRKSQLESQENAGIVEKL